MKIQIKVKPNSKKQKIEELEDGSLLVHLKSSPVKGKANQELIKALAKKYQVTQSKVSIKHGLSSKNKLIEIVAILISMRCILDLGFLPKG